MGKERQTEQPLTGRLDLTHRRKRRGRRDGYRKTDQPLGDRLDLTQEEERGRLDLTDRRKRGRRDGYRKRDRPAFNR